MKKVTAGLLIMMALSCTNRDKAPTTSEGSSNTPNVENVNGNMPDTSSSVNLENPPKAEDSSRRKDSIRK